MNILIIKAKAEKQVLSMKHISTLERHLVPGFRVAKLVLHFSSVHPAPKFYVFVVVAIL